MSVKDQTRKIYYGVPEHHNGTVGTAPIPIWVGNPTQDGNYPPRWLLGVIGTPTFARSVSMCVFVDNMDDANNLYVSLDGGVTYKTLRPNQNIAIDCAIMHLLIYGDVAGQTYEIIIVHEETINLVGL